MQNEIDKEIMSGKEVWEWIKLKTEAMEILKNSYPNPTDEQIIMIRETLKGFDEKIEEEKQRQLQRIKECLKT